MEVEGVWLPIITPFLAGKVDFISYQRLIDYYIQKGITGLIPLGTTGESPTIEDDEFEEIVEKTVLYNQHRVPIYIGLGGNSTQKIVKRIKTLEKYKIDGILSVCPYFNRPDQRGIFQHFKQIAEASELKIIIYNIPYRTGRNIENETIYRLAEIHNIVGIKDACGDLKQTTELLMHPPVNFSILTGEDVLFYTTLALGGGGGILAAAHLDTEKYLQVYQFMRDNNHQAALAKWREIVDVIPMLFAEANPAPLKYCLHKLSLIQSLEIRLPLTEISDGLKEKLDRALQKVNKG